MGKVGCLKSKIKSEVRVLGCPQTLQREQICSGSKNRSRLPGITSRCSPSTKGRLVAAKAQVTRARRKLEEYVAWNRANNLFFDEATDEELAQFRAKLARKIFGVEAAEERMKRKIWNLKNEKND